jgi:hypothetical protein
MKNSPLVALIAILGWTLLGSQTARATDIKFPEKTNPAFSFTVADDVKSAPDDYGNLRLMFPKGYAIVLNMIDLTSESEIDRTAKDPLAAMAKVAMDSAKIESTGKTEPVEIDGKKGTAFFATKDFGAGRKVNFKMILVRIDDRYVASIGVVTGVAISADDQNSLDKLIQSFKFTQSE